jgi:hypothetical protein
MRSLLERITQTFFAEPKLHPLEAKMAKHWIRQRLINLFPHLGNDPQKLNEAYEALSLTPTSQHLQSNAGGPVYEMTTPRDPLSP